MRKLKAGLILLAAQWFLDVGIQNNDAGKYNELPGITEKDSGEILKAVGKYYKVVYPGHIYSVEAAQKAVKLFKTNEVDVVILIHLMWSEDGPLVEILKGIKDIPILLWCYNPYKKLPEKMSMLELFRSSGAVGILQGSAPMKRMNIKFSYVFGNPGDSELDRQLKDYSNIYETAIALKNLRIGQIGPRCECMTGTYVEEFRLKSELGVTLVPITANRLYEVSNSLSDSEVSDYINQLKSRYKVQGVSDKSLYYTARATLAVEKVIQEENLGAIAIEDLNPELHKVMKTRPCLWTDSLTEKKIVVGMEGDVISTLGMWVARHLGDSAPMYTEIFTYDNSENAILMGHAAMHDLSLAGANEVTIVPDFEYEAADEVEGAWLHFSARPGEVTVISTFADVDKYRMFVFKGESLPVQDKLQGFPSAYVKINTPLENFFEKAVELGMTQHFAISYDDIGRKLKKFCEIVGMEYVEL